MFQGIKVASNRGVVLQQIQRALPPSKKVAYLGFLEAVVEVVAAVIVMVVVIVMVMVIVIVVVIIFVIVFVVGDLYGSSSWTPRTPES